MYSTNSSGKGWLLCLVKRQEIGWGGHGPSWQGWSIPSRDWAPSWSWVGRPGEPPGSADDERRFERYMTEEEKAYFLKVVGVQWMLE